MKPSASLILPPDKASTRSPRHPVRILLNSIGGLKLNRILDIAIQLAWGLDHAHAHGLVHQDMKPANAMITRKGLAKVTDFGLAKARAAAGERPTDSAGASPLASDGGRTPAYCSPEQAHGERLTPATDVWSWALSVLEMFTGGPPVTAGQDAAEALEAAVRQGPPDNGIPALPGVLADLLRNCFQAEPDARPSQMDKLAQTLIESYIDLLEEPYPRTRSEPAELLTDELNNRALSLLDLDRHAEADRAFAQALVVDSQNARAIYNAGLTRGRRGGVTDQAFIAELQATRSVIGNPWELRYALALIHLERGDVDRASTLLVNLARERPDDPEIRETLRKLHSGEIVNACCVDAHQVQWPERPIPRDPWEQARMSTTVADRVPLALTPDGRLMIAGGWDGAIRLYDVHSGLCVSRLNGHSKPVCAVDLTPDGRFAVSVCRDEIVRFWDLTRSRFADPAAGRILYASPEPRWPDRNESPRSVHIAVRLSNDGRLALYTDPKGVFRVWDVRTGKITILDQATPNGLVEVSADGRWALSVRSLWSLRSGHDREDAVRLWDLANGRCERELRPGHKPAVTALCFSADGRYAVTAGFDDIRVWDLNDDRCVHVLASKSAASTAATLSLSADARFLLSGSQYESATRLWELNHGRCLRTFQAHEGGTTVVHLDADARFALSAGQDKMVRRWELPGGHRSTPLLSRPRPHVELSQLGSRVDALVADAEQAMAAGRLPAALDLLRQARAVKGYERAPRVMSAWWSIGRHSVRTGLRAAWSSRLETSRINSVQAVDLTGDGRIAVSGNEDGTVLLWDLGDRACMRVLEGHKHMVESVCLSSDGRLALSSSRDGTVRLWEVDTGTCQQILTVTKRRSVEGSQPVLGNSLPVRFSIDARHAVIGGKSGPITLWDLKTGTLARNLDGSGTGIIDMCIGDDGHLAAVTYSNQLKLWDIDSGRIVLNLQKSSLEPLMMSVSRSADGRLTLTGGGDGLQVLNTVTGDVIRIFDRPAQSGFLHTVRVTADGRFAISGGYWSYMTVWDARSGQCIRVLDGHEQGTSSLALTPDGRFVLTGHDSHLRLWELDWELAAQDRAG